MDPIKYVKSYSKVLQWIDIKNLIYSDLIELEKERMTYNTALLPMSSLALEIDPVQNRYILIANKSIAIIDTFDKNQLDATLFPEKLSPHRGFIRDLSWFPCDNSITATLSNAGQFNLIDMNQISIVDSFELNIPCNCVKFDSSGNFPFSVAIGTKQGLRYCDLKSGSQIQLLKTKFDVESVEYSPKNPHEVYTGLSNGKLLLWDLRKTVRPISELVHPTKIESSVKQISHSFSTNGSILVGFGNGDIVAYCSTTHKTLWTQSSDPQNFSKNMFVSTSCNQLIRPIRRKFIFIDSIYGNIISSCENDLLSMPSAIIMNPINNDIFVFDSNYIGSIFRFKPKKICQEIIF